MENVTLILIITVGLLYVVTTRHMMIKTHDSLVVERDKIGFLLALFFLPGQIAIGVIIMLDCNLIGLFNGPSTQVKVESSTQDE